MTEWNCPHCGAMVDDHDNDGIGYCLVERRIVIAREWPLPQIPREEA